MLTTTALWMRRSTMALATPPPDPVDGGSAETGASRHGASAPVGGIARRGFQRLHQHRFDLIVTDAPRRSAALFVEKTRQALGDVTRTPLADGGVNNPQFSGDLGVAESAGAAQQDLRSQGQRLGSLASSRPALQGGEVFGGDDEFGFGATALHVRSPRRVGRMKPTILSRTSETGHCLRRFTRHVERGRRA